MVYKHLERAYRLVPSDLPAQRTTEEWYLHCVRYIGLLLWSLLYGTGPELRLVVEARQAHLGWRAEIKRYELMNYIRELGLLLDNKLPIVRSQLEAEYTPYKKALEGLDEVIAISGPTPQLEAAKASIEESSSELRLGVESSYCRSDHDQLLFKAVKATGYWYRVRTEDMLRRYDAATDTGVASYVASK